VETDVDAPIGQLIETAEAGGDDGAADHLEPLSAALDMLTRVDTALAQLVDSPVNSLGP
jgi:hypothetical protein